MAYSFKTRKKDGNHSMSVMYTDEKAKKSPAKGKKKTFPPLPKDGEDMPKKLPKGANSPSPDNPWIKR